MKERMILVSSCVLMLVLTGCGGGGVGGLRVIGSQAIEELPEAPEAIMAAAPDGAVMLASDETIYRIDPKKRTVETIFEGDANTAISAMTVAEDGLLYVADGGRLRLFAGGHLHDLLESNSDSAGRWSLSGWGEAQLYVAESRPGRSTLFSYETRGKNTFGMAETEQPIRAISAVRGGCLVATENTIYKVFDRSDDVSADVLCLMVCSIAPGDREIRSMAADEKSRAVYYSTEDGTWAYVDGQIVPLLPVGGVLAFARNTLNVWDGVNRQLLQLGNPARRARAAVKAVYQ